MRIQVAQRRAVFGTDSVGRPGQVPRNRAAGWPWMHRGRPMAQELRGPKRAERVWPEPAGPRRDFGRSRPRTATQSAETEDEKVAGLT